MSDEEREETLYATGGQAWDRMQKLERRMHLLELRMTQQASDEVSVRIHPNLDKYEMPVSAYERLIAIEQAAKALTETFGQLTPRSRCYEVFDKYWALDEALNRK